MFDFLSGQQRRIIRQEHKSLLCVKLRPGNVWYVCDQSANRLIVVGGGGGHMMIFICRVSGRKPQMTAGRTWRVECRLAARFLTSRRNVWKCVITHSRMFRRTSSWIPASARILPEIDFLFHGKKMRGEEEEQRFC